MHFIHTSTGTNPMNSSFFMWSKMNQKFQRKWICIAVFHIFILPHIFTLIVIPFGILFNIQIRNTNEKPENSKLKWSEECLQELWPTISMKLYFCSQSISLFAQLWMLKTVRSPHSQMYPIVLIHGFIARRDKNIQHF